MDILDHFYNLNYSDIRYFPRRYNIGGFRKSLIYGSPSSGKTYIALNYLNSLDRDKSLYIDLQDPKLEFNPIRLSDIERFILDNGIETLIVDNYIEGFFSRELNVDSIVVVSSKIYQELKGYHLIKVSYLNFRELLSSHRRDVERHRFNLFIKRGRVVQLALNVDRPREELFKTFIRRNFSPLEERILIVLSHFNGSNVTTHHIYTYAKRRFKISKDSIYKKVSEFKDRELIFFIDDILNRNGKKLILFDFALAGYLSLSQKFIKQFDTMVALSLIEDRLDVKSFGSFGYLTDGDILVTPSPFESRDSSYKRAKDKIELYIEHNIKSIHIVTVSTHYNFKISGIEFYALPFYEWALM